MNRKKKKREKILEYAARVSLKSRRLEIWKLKWKENQRSRIANEEKESLVGGG